MECDLPYKERGCIGCSESVCIEDLPYCGCGNPDWNLECICEHLDANEGTTEYNCEWHGCYHASKPVCSDCEEGQYIVDLSK